MMPEKLGALLPEYAKDIKLNLASVLSADNAGGLNAEQIAGVALASAYAIKHPLIIEAVEAEVDKTSVIGTGAKIAATIMSMNNIYYRFVHLVHDEAFAQMPAKLRMTAMMSPGVAKTDFELYSIAVSALNGCGKCLDAHVAGALKQEITHEMIQHAVRIAAVLYAVAQVLAIEHS